ncbi:S10 family peptidase [Actinokineospora sp. UTMC 2448]|uniref:S10 family peptidase n=1 Tax=Actinokineospora sp. UTMC 2448 TaxID=2268449 RepID=UPI00216490F6|nr:peptidase S10 [Actinokineospora sp. UTMC 2448]UVS76985.1 Serine carboxypeptidase [Actinokineospora sp. UTMC 2448]
MPSSDTHDETVTPTKPDATAPEPADDLVTTQHVLAAGRRKLKYTATTGRIVLRQEVTTDGKFTGHVPKASVFLTAYTLDDAEPATRPVTFAFNGGPGSSSTWLHLGVLGPRRVVSGDAGALAAPPYALADNPESLLAHSDLVFIDPMSTGYTRPVDGEGAQDHLGFTGDLECVGEVIRLWTTRNGRWLSPKFLAGESYGTTRAGGLALHLQQRHGMYLNGLMLISSVLDFGTLNFKEGNDLPYALFLPTYAAIAHYHGLHGKRPLKDVLAEAEEFAAKDYPWALAQGSRLSSAERASAVERVARLTGLSADYIDRVDLRIEHMRFFAELLRPSRRTVGRLDGRFTGWESDYGRELSVDDPSATAITGAYTAAINHYLRAELGYTNDLAYEVLSVDAHKAWSYKDFENSHVTVTDRLSKAMRGNPHLKVHVASGYTDGATPYFATEHTIAHLSIPDELRGNIEVKYYPAGHMMYVHEPSRVQQSKDLAAFVKSAS